MPRLSLWNPVKNNDYRFFDRNIREQFHVGGTGLLVHKYIGPEDGKQTDDPSQPAYQNDDVINETSIQDLLFLETRDRKYEKDIYELRGVYNVSDNDFDLTQFGLFLTNDTLYMTVHLNEMVEIIGRKLISGDVIELPHLIEEYGLDADTPPIPKFYTVTDGNRGGEGFSPTWWPHIWRIKIEPITDSQEFDDIIGTKDDEDALSNIISTFDTELEITDAVAETARQNDPAGGHQTVDHLYNYIDMQGISISTGDTFPANANDGDHFIRTDFKPNRLFRYTGSKWERLEDNVDDRLWAENVLNASTFVNNKEIIEDGVDDVIEPQRYKSRQSIDDAIRPKPTR